MTEREAYMRQGESAKDEIFQLRAQKSSPKIPLTNAPTRRSRASKIREWNLQQICRGGRVRYERAQQVDRAGGESGIRIRSEATNKGLNRAQLAILVLLSRCTAKN